MHDKWLLLLICDINTLHAMWPYFQHNKNLLSICISKDCPTCAVIAWNAKVSVTENNQRFISYNANFTLGQLGALLHIIFILILSFKESSLWDIVVYHLSEKETKGCSGSSSYMTLPSARENVFSFPRSFIALVIP